LKHGEIELFAANDFNAVTNVNHDVNFYNRNFSQKKPQMRCLSRKILVVDLSILKADLAAWINNQLFKASLKYVEILLTVQLQRSWQTVFA
jgi:hypothetical protein